MRQTRDVIRLGLEQGGLSMLTIFKRMLDEYEARHREKQKKR